MLAPIQLEEKVAMAVNGIEIAVGQLWRTRCGDVVRVGSIDDHDDFPVNLLNVRTGEDFGSCGKNGKAWGDIGDVGESSDDLTHLLHDEAAQGVETPAEQDGEEVKPAIFGVDMAGKPDRSMLTIEVPKGYEKLLGVLVAALDQAANGKGKERHASDGIAFEDQPMSSINRTLNSVDGFLYQAAKKAQESRRLPSGRAQAELLGAINYLAGAVIAYDTWAAGLLPQQDERMAAVEERDWISWHGGERPVEGDTLVNARLRSGRGVVGAIRADCLSWQHKGTYSDIVAWRLAK